MRIQTEPNTHSPPKSDISNYPYPPKMVYQLSTFQIRTGKAPKVSAKEDDKDDYIVLRPRTFGTFYFYYIDSCQIEQLDSHCHLSSDLVFSSTHQAYNLPNFYFFFVHMCAIITSFINPNIYFLVNAHMPPAWS